MADFSTVIVSTQQLGRLSTAVHGLFGFYSDQGLVAAPSGLQVSVAAVAAGSYVINGSIINTAYAGSTVTCGAAHASLPRIDTVIINSSGAVSIVAGTAAADPVPPTLSSTQLELCMIYVGANVTNLVGGNLVDRRQRLFVGPQYKYKTASQSLTDATFVNVTATSGDMAFSVAANKTYRAEFLLNLAAVGTAGTDGLKLALTHPASPTAVSYLGDYEHLDAYVSSDGAATLNDQYQYRAVITSAGTTSGAEFFSENAGGTKPSTTAAATSGLMPGLVRVSVLFINGANAGTVTLQAAQKTNGAGTTQIVAAQMFVQPVEAVA